MSIPWIAVGLALTVGASSQRTAATPADVRTLPHAELSTALSTLAANHADLVTLHRVGLSREGRSIDALRITAVDEPSQHPALLLVANLEGPRTFESGVALHHAERLASEYASSEAVQALLDSTVVWVIPRANPDPAEARFREPLHESWAGASGVDNDRDGRNGEDPASDVNGDGRVTWMRVVDPDGTWMEDPTDARVLIEADPAKGERGRWKLYPESRDRDGDEEPGEDPVGDTRADKNFASGWQEHTVDGGLFPTDEPETRGLCEFVMAQSNLVLVVAYDGQDNLVEEPESVDDDAPSVKRIPPAGVLASDAKLLGELGERYRDATGNEATGSAEDSGTFTRWCYDHRGLLVLQAVIWNLPDEAPEPEAGEEESGEEEAENDDAEEDEDAPEPSQDAKHLQWIDAAGEDWRFVDWTAFDHPELGSVEIGGFAPFARLEPQADAWGPTADTHFDWFVGLGALLPRVALAECALEDQGSGLWELTAVVENDGYLPLLTRSMRRTRTTRPARVELVLPEAAQLLSGAPQELLRELPGSGGRVEYTWLLHGPAGMEVGVQVDTDHAGETFRKAEVTR